jgi:alpha-pyrone synthase
MAARCEIEHRYSVLQPHPDHARIDADGFYALEAFPDTETRMRFYETHAFPLARQALAPN